MKKYILPFLFLLFLVSCAEESDMDSMLEQHHIHDIGETNFKKSDKVGICHKGKMIQVNTNSLNAHLNHGDEVEFGQLGIYRKTYNLGNREFIHEGEVTHSENGSFSGFGQSLTTGQEWTLSGEKDNDGNYSFRLDYTNSIYYVVNRGVFDCAGSGYSGDWDDSNSQAGTWTGIYLVN